MNRLSRNMDVVGAIMGLAVMAASLIALVIKGFHPIYYVAVSVGIVCVIIYLTLRHKITITQYRNNSGDKQFIHGTIVAVLLLLAGILVYVFRAEQYVKPISYYIIIAAATGITVMTAICASTSRRFVAILVIACVIGLTHVWTENLMFPASLTGIDPWHHMKVVMTELTSGTTEVNIGVTTLGGPYSLMHLYFRLIIDITGISYKMSTLVFGSSVLIIGNAVLVGLIGRRLFNSSVGAVAAVVVSMANWNIFFGEWVIPNSIGATLSLATAYIMLSKIRLQVQAPLIAIMVAAAYFTHIIAAIWVVGTVACLLMPSVATTVRWVREHRITRHNWRRSLAYMALATVVVISFPLWMAYTTNGKAIAYTSGQYEFSPSLGLMYAVGSAPVIEPDNYSGTSTGAIPILTVEQLSQNIIGELTVDSIGMFLYIGIAIFGILVILRKHRQVYGRMWAILGIAVLAVGFFPPLFGKSLLEPRWWYFAEVLLAVPLALAVVSVANSRKRTALVCVLTCIVAFASTVGLPSNITNRTLSPNLIVRYAMTDDEMRGIDAIESLHPKLVGTDPLYYNVIITSEQYSGPDNSVIPIEYGLITGDLSQVEADFIVIREAVYTEPFGFGGGTIYKIDPKIMDVINSYGYQEIWSNGAVHILERK